MPSTIVLPELMTLRSMAVRHSVEKIGMNIRPLEPNYDEKEGLWKVPCVAIISNYVENEEKNGKTFVYNFENIGYMAYEKRGDEYKLINYPLQGEVENEISKRYFELTKDIERDLLEFGSDCWGEFTLVKQYLSPIYSIMAHLLDAGYLSFSLINYEKNYKFIKLLTHSKYMKIDSDNERLFVEGNKLTIIKEKIYEYNYDSISINFIENIVGKIFAEYYNEIKYDIGINAPSSYIDTTKAYYFDALRYGDVIGVTENNIKDNVIFYGTPLVSPRDLNFKKSLLELSSTKLLHKSGKYYYGDIDLYEKLSYHRETLLQGVESIN